MKLNFLYNFGWLHFYVSDLSRGHFNWSAYFQPDIYITGELPEAPCGYCSGVSVSDTYLFVCGENMMIIKVCSDTILEKQA